MSTDIVLAILKLTSISLAGIMGVIALLVDFKDHRGGITKWGKRALIGVITSTLIAATIHGIEDYRRNHEAAAASERNRQLLSEISRGAYLLRDVSVSATLDYPLDYPSLQDYYGRAYLMIRDLSPGEYTYDDGSDPFIRYNSSTNQTVALYSSSTVLFPNKNQEPLAWAVFSQPPGLNFSFYSKGRNLQERDKVPDLRFHLKPGKFIMDYRSDENRLLVKMNNLWVDKQQENVWESNGRIISWEDLAGAQMFVTLSKRKGEDPQLVEEITKADRAAKLGDIRLQISQRTYCISNADLKKESDGYKYRFAEDLKSGECR